MTKRCALLISATVAIAALLLPACGPKPTPEQILAQARYNHEIIPVGANTIFNENGEPTLLVDLQVTNKGGIPLRHLTVLVLVRGEGGLEKASRRVTLDLGEMRPGIGTRVSASVPGVALDETDEVTVELENDLPPDVLRGLPEFKDVENLS
jgi:hypothetical protein